MKSKKLKPSIKEEVREIVSNYLTQPSTMETEGETIAVWVISLLENIHNYDDWFIEDHEL